ncbi:hypothetical protein [Nocardioides sp. SYSU DS0651]|uniref:hypothetical protein n=1 Tax=Nocardioides sp. SYSU DS0651 TaxID=3415955 RepID=UPI003F4B3D32
MTEQPGAPEPTPPSSSNAQPPEPPYASQPPQAPQAPQAPYPAYGQPQQAYQPGPVQQPPVGYGLPVVGAKIPGQVDPETGLVYSDKERLTAGLCQLLPCLFGIPGIGRLYTGHVAIGVVQLVGAIVGIVLTCILIGLPLWIGMVIWGVVDGILMFTNKAFTDAQGRVLR